MVLTFNLEDILILLIFEQWNFREQVRHAVLVGNAPQEWPPYVGVDGYLVRKKNIWKIIDYVRKLEEREISCRK